MVESYPEMAEFGTLLSQILSGNHEHLLELKQLTTISTHWKEALEFLDKYQSWQDPQKVTAIRQLLQTYAKCEDEVTRRKLHVKMRLKRASASVQNQSTLELHQKLINKREQLLSELRAQGDKIRSLEHQAIQLGYILEGGQRIKHLQEESQRKLTKLGEQWKILQDSLPLAITEKNHRECQAASLEAEIRHILFLFKPSESEPAVTLLKKWTVIEICHCLTRIMESLIEKVREAPSLALAHVKAKEGALYECKSIQGIALELGRIWHLLSEDGSPEAQNMARQRLSLIQVSHLEGQLPLCRPEPTPPTGLIGVNLDKQLIPLTESISNDLDRVKKLFTRLNDIYPNLMEKLLIKLNNIFLPQNQLKQEMEFDIITRHIIDELVKHADQKYNLEGIQSGLVHDDTEGIQRLELTHNQVIAIEETTKARINKFSTENTAIEAMTYDKVLKSILLDLLNSSSGLINKE